MSSTLPALGALPAGPTPDVEVRLRTFLARACPVLEQAIAAAVETHPAIPGAVSNALCEAVGVGGRGGRRWRPLLTLAAARTAGGRMADAMSAAVAIELTHTASLVLDDLPCMDDAEERRGRPALHTRVGTSGAILAAISCLSRSVELLATAGPAGASLCAEWGRTTGLDGMSGGQLMDLAGGIRLRGAERRLFRQKSTALAALAARAGAAAVGATPALVTALERFGRDIGWAYQLRDDIRDHEEDGIAPASRPSRFRTERHVRILSARASRRLYAAGPPDRAAAEVLAAMGRELAQRGTLEARAPRVAAVGS